MERDTGIRVEMGQGDVRFFPAPGVRASNLALSHDGAVFLRAGKMRLEVSIGQLLVGQASYDKLVLDDVELNLTGKETGALAEAVVSAVGGLERVVMTSGEILTGDGQRARLNGLDATVAADGVSGSAEIALQTLPMRLTYALRRQEATSTDMPWQFAAEADGPLFKLSFTGFAGRNFASFDGKTSLVTPSLRSFLSFLGSPLPEGPGFDVAQVDASASYIPGSGLNLKDMRLRLDGNVASGALQMSLAELSTLQGTVAFDVLDLQPYTHTDETGFATFIADLNHWRKGWQADVRLSADRLRLKGHEGSFAGSLVVNRQMAELAIASTTLGAADLSGRLALTSPPEDVPSYEVNLNAKAFDSSVLRILLPAQFAPAGTVNGSMTLVTSGEDIASVRRNLQGDATIQGTTLTLAGVSLGDAIDRLVNGKAFLAWPLSTRSETRIETFVMTARMNGGRLMLDEAKGRLNGWEVAATGEVDLERSRIELGLDISSPGTQEKTAAQLEGELTLPVWRPITDRPEEAELSPEGAPKAN